MKKLTCSLIITLISFTVTAQPCKEVVGYYAGWKYHKRNKLVNPGTIIYSNYTIINYAFFKPLPNGQVVAGDPYTDNLILLGSQNQQKQYDKSLAYCQKLMELDAKDGKALYQAGLCFQKKGQKDRGQQMCDKAIEMDPSLTSLRRKKEIAGM